MLTKNRLEAFSDGVFAIAITLLVIEIRPPTPAEGESLARALWEQWPHYLGYFLSFLVLGVMWLNHHRIFEPAQRVDGIVLVLNLNLLLWAVLIPFPTAVVAHLPTPQQVRAARLRFGLGVGVYTVAFVLSWLSPALALAAHGAMAAYYLTEQSSRLNADEVKRSRE